MITRKGLVDLTSKHYAEKCITHVKHQILKPKLTSYSEDDLTPSYEAAPVMVVQWCQPVLENSNKSVAKQLDKLAIASLSHLLELYPNHPIFTKIRSEQSDRTNVSLTQLPELATRLTSNLWSSQDCHQIMSSANHVLYTVEGFMGNSGDYYNSDNSYINRIMEAKQGIPITMCLLYTCIMARLGVHCLPVNFP